MQYDWKINVRSHASKKIPSLFIYFSQHYERDADGLVCALRTPLQKKGGLEFSVDTEDFKKGMFNNTEVPARIACSINETVLYWYVKAK